MNTCKIVIIGESKTFKSTLAQLIKEVLYEVEDARFVIKDDSPNNRYFNERVDKLVQQSWKTPIEIEVITTNREPKQEKGDAYERLED